MLETIKLVFTQFYDETIMIAGSLLALVSVILILVWMHNKKKFNNMLHQIPASVVKNYLDTIIQNSNSLKSSLFRGGGIDIPPSILPSIGGGGGVDMEMINRKNAEIATLQSQLIERNSIIRDLEGQNSSLKTSSGDAGEAIALKKKNADLENEIKRLKESASSGSSGGGADPAQLEAVSKERDELKEKLKEYEIIEDDLANLKKLQQENEDLKKKLAGGGAAVAAVAAVAAAPEPEPAPAPAPEEPAPAPEAAAPAPEPTPEPTPEPPPAAPLPKEEGGEKSAEDLLSEFEKMLG